MTAILLTLFFVLTLFSNGQAFRHEMGKIAYQVATCMGDNQKKSVAVFDFPNAKGKQCQAGRLFAEEISSELASKYKQIHVIDRARLMVILKEQQLSMTGITDQDTALKIGKIANVNVILVGTLTSLEKTVRVNCKVIDVNTSRILDSPREDVKKTKELSKLLGGGVGGWVDERKKKLGDLIKR